MISFRVRDKRFNGTACLLLKEVEMTVTPTKCLKLAVLSTAILCTPAFGQGLLWTSLLNQGDKAVDRHDDKTARQLYESALKQLDGNDDKAAKLETIVKLGDCDLRLGDSAAAATLYQQALPLAQSVCVVGSKEFGYVLIRVGQSEVEQNKLVEAERHLTAALKIENENPSSARASLMRAMSDLYSKQKKTVEADALRREAEQPERGPRPAATPTGRWSSGYISPPGNLLGRSLVAVVSKPAKETRISMPAPTLATDVDFGPYMADLQRRIKKHWSPPKGSEKAKVVVTFNIGAMGELSELRIDRSSGALAADNAALAAVNNSASFRPLPSGAPPVVRIQFTFDRNLFSGRPTPAALRQF